jgi:hypothetical protein
MNIKSLFLKIIDKKIVKAKHYMFSYCLLLFYLHWIIVNHIEEIFLEKYHCFIKILINENNV